MSERNLGVDMMNKLVVGRFQVRAHGCGGKPIIPVVTGGQAFWGRISASRLVGEGHRVICLDNFQTGRRENVGDLAARDGSSSLIMTSRCRSKGSSAVRPDLQSRLPGIAAALPGRSRPTAPTCSHGTYTCRGRRNATERGFPGLDVRDLRRSRGASSAREVPWQRQSSRSALLLRRRKAVRRDACHDSGRRHGLATRIARIFNTTGRACSPRWPRGVELHRPGTARSGRHLYAPASRPVRSVS